MTIALFAAACGQGQGAKPAAPAAGANPSSPPPAFTPVVEPTANNAAMVQAFMAAFPGAPPFTIGYPAAPDGSTMAHSLQFTPSALIDLSPTVVALVSKGEGTNTNYTCEACAGAVSIDYLQRGPQGFSHLGHWDLQGGSENQGETAPWTLRNDIDTVPVLVFVYIQGEQGCTSTLDSFIELTPAGAKDAGSAILNSGHQAQDGVVSSGDYQYSGALSVLVKGQSLAVDYTGSASQRVVFSKGADGKFELPGDGPQSFPPVC
jgi:hypothetical protein